MRDYPMIIHRALSKTDDGNFEIDLTVIRTMAEAFDNGVHNDECILAKFIVAAYETGFDQGVIEADMRQRNTALLLLHTAGNA